MPTIHTALLWSALACAGTSHAETPSSNTQAEPAQARSSDDSSDPKRELARELAMRRAATPRDDLAQRTELARWMLSKQLAREALEELDSILEREPDRLGARELLAAGPFRPRLDPKNGELEAWLQFGASTRAAERELAVQGLKSLTRDEASSASVRSALVQRLAQRSGEARRFAAFALRRASFALTESDTRALCVRAVIDPLDRVRAEAARALRDSRDARVGQSLARGFESRALVVRQHTAEALAVLGPAAIEPLGLRLAALASAAQSAGALSAPRSNLSVLSQVAYVQDFDVEIAQAASIADPVVDVSQSGVVLDVAVRGAYQLPIEAEARAVARALERVTPQGFGDDANKWHAWWQKRVAKAEHAAAAKSDSTGAR